MKKLVSLFAGFFFLVLSINAGAQAKTGADYFDGKWNLLIKGASNGDRKMVFVLAQKDTTINGVVQDTSGKELSKIEKAEVSVNTITVYFTINNHDVSMELIKKDDDFATGTAAGMFNVEAERAKGMKQ